MKKILIILTFVFILTNQASSGENDYRGELENCKDYKISPHFLICEMRKAGNNFKRKLTTKKDGSQNVLGRWFNAKSLSDFNK